MQSILQINVRDLIQKRTVESARLEFQADWNPCATGSQVLKTICAFANDINSLNGGYVVIGVEESGGRAVLPAKGLAGEMMDQAQKWIRRQCKATFSGYMPVLSPEKVGDSKVVVVWCPPSEDRPHRAPIAPDRHKELKYWVRKGSETVDAEASGLLNALMERSTRMPWDNRTAHAARIEDLSGTLVRKHLHGVESALRDDPDMIAIYRSMRIIDKVNGNVAPRNVGLLFFSDSPERWFPCARIEVRQFADSAGTVQDSHAFKGPLTAQLRDCLRHLEGISREHLNKEYDRSQVKGWVGYPVPALREALVNAVYHRSYRPDILEPTKIGLYPDRIEIISYPGPVTGIEREHLLPNANRSSIPVPARNPRIGEFLKQLGLAEEWRTGLPAIYNSMARNGSPTPKFDFDEGRQWFRTTLPAHPEYAAVSALRDAAYLRAVSGVEDAFVRVRDAWEGNESSAVLASEMIQLCAERDDLETAEHVFRRFRASEPDSLAGNVTNRWIEVLWRNERVDDARKLLDEIPRAASAHDAVDSAILARRLGESQIAHRYFESAGSIIGSDARALLEFAQTKIQLARHARKKGRRDWRQVNRRLLTEARELLERAVRMDASPARHAWAWRELGRVLNWTGAPSSDVEGAYENAKRLLPDQHRFSRELEQYRERRKAGDKPVRTNNGRSARKRR